MYDLKLHAIAKKYKGEFGAGSAIFSQTDGATTRVTFTIPIGMTGYLLKHGGYAQKTDILAEFKTETGDVLFNWEEYPDSTFEEYQLPLTEYAFKNKLVVDFTNSSGSSTDILIKVSILLIPTTKEDLFEKAIDRLG